jgi:hypothetical protein
MLSIQKSLTDKTGLGYVASSSEIPSTSRTIFVKPTVPEPPTTVRDKRKEVIGGDIPVTEEATQKLPTIRLKAQRSQVKKELPRQATFDTRPLARHQAPQHQAPQQQRHQ